MTIRSAVALVIAWMAGRLDRIAVRIAEPREGDPWDVVRSRVVDAVVTRRDARS